MIQNFDSVDDFIITIFPDIETYMGKQLLSNIQWPDLVTITYSEFERRFKMFIVQNHSAELNEYLNKETKHANKETMKQILLSTISITLNVRNVENYQLKKSDYLVSIGNIIKKIGL